MEKNEDKAYETYIKERNLIYKLNEILMELFSIGAHSEDQVEFAKHLTDYIQQTITNCIEIGLARGMLPISKIDVWYGMLGGEKKEFMYRLSTIGGQPYVELKLQRISELLENAVNAWADESWEKTVKFSGEEQPRWIIDEEE